MFAFFQRGYLSWQRHCAKLDVFVIFWMCRVELWLCSWWLSAEHRRASREILRAKLYKIVERFDSAYPPPLPPPVEEKKIEPREEKRPQRIRRELNRLKY